MLPTFLTKHGGVTDRKYSQVWIQPFYGFVEASAFRYFPNSRFLQWELFAVEVSLRLFVRYLQIRAMAGEQHASC